MKITEFVDLRARTNMRGKIVGYEASFGGVTGGGKTKEQALDALAAVAKRVAQHYGRRYYHCDEGAVLCLYMDSLGNYAYDITRPHYGPSQSASCTLSTTDWREAVAFAENHAQQMGWKGESSRRSVAPNTSAVL